MFKKRLQSCYTDYTEFESYDSCYGITSRLERESAIELWNENPIIKGGINPASYQIVNEVYRLTGTRRQLGNNGTSENFKIVCYNVCHNDTPKESMTSTRNQFSRYYDHILFTKVERRGVNGRFYNVPMMQALELE